MGQQVIKQPNGSYAVWSSIVDNFILLNASKEEIVEYYIARESKRVKELVDELVERADNPDSGNQFTLSYESALDRISRVHGPEEVEEALVTMYSEKD
jgi:hypothetical protein